MRLILERLYPTLIETDDRESSMCKLHTIVGPKADFVGPALAKAL